jgi:DNA-binding XRE family transcriptional regulator
MQTGTVRFPEGLAYPYRWKCTQSVPKEPQTVGEHIKRRRLELHLFQSDLAKKLGVNVQSIRNWEKNTYQPIERLMTGIVKWLGYDPRKAVSLMTQAIHPEDNMGNLKLYPAYTV